MRLRKFLPVLLGAVLVGSVSDGTAQAVVGGGPADEPYPFMASLQVPEEPRFHCGATLIDQEWLLTAAHCVDSFEADQLSARIGSPDRTTGGEQRGIAEKVPHPDHRQDFLAQYDFALLKLDRPVDLPTVAIAESAQPPGKDVRVIGWGRECSYLDCGPTLAFPRVLKQFDSEVGADSECHNTDGTVDICVRGLGDASMCNGDSGGPALVREPGGRWEQVGIASRFGAPDPGAGCAAEPDIFADPVAVRDWIAQEIGA
ncbi:serine protease [Saccharopolyspora sp. NPDC000359]|uniref:S1 family peptidase n=1 Tax=Saccharopolyspora sp. NPDC000359 TaxID=3154251 RepID=UPI00331B49E4